MTTAATKAADQGDGFMPRAAATRSQTLVGAFCVLLLAGAFAASATVTLACVGLSSRQTGAAEPTHATASPTGAQG